MAVETKAKFRPKLKHAVYLLGLVVAAFVLHELFFMVQITAGISNEKPEPEHFVTLEIVNASGIPQISKQVAAKIDKKKPDDMAITLVNTERLEYRDISKSLVISRDENTELAKIIAEVIGLDKSEVVYRPSIENDLSPSVTLVLGEDIAQILNPEKTNQEASKVI